MRAISEKEAKQAGRAQALPPRLKDYIVAGHSEILMQKTIGPWSTFQRDD